MKKKARLIFISWADGAWNPVNTYENDLPDMDFHPGCFFEAEIELDEDQQEQLDEALAKGYYPMVVVKKD